MMHSVRATATRCTRRMSFSTERSRFRHSTNMVIHISAYTALSGHSQFSLGLIIDLMLVFGHSVKYCPKPPPHLVESDATCAFKPSPNYVMSGLTQTGSSITHTSTSSPQHLRNLCTNVNLHNFLCRVKPHLGARQHSLTSLLSFPAMTTQLIFRPLCKPLRVKPRLRLDSVHCHRNRASCRLRDSTVVFRLRIHTVIYPASAHHFWICNYIAPLLKRSSRLGLVE
ncbi:uncharacterized protein BJ212DRAFT_692998 [Suillus subaureus]|uniref:Uncharacterized protein n=1 Tax=Suillus subaureus TaxID=48587 RepID=A0A9P7EKU5_9AGAM|nr:uncharacterized protein BJ212DRAFT_692998 [Suillus subaureus]KAG1823585.1 hypothetical protein BJ212DRAFT_692998 [Suillus subaureus]